MFTDKDGNVLVDGVDYDLVPESLGTRRGRIDFLRSDLNRFDINFLINAGGEQLTGQEAVELTLANSTDTRGAKASLADEELDCDPTPPKQEPSFLLSAEAACIKTETELLTDAEFSFAVSGNREGDIRGVYEYAWEYGGTSELKD